jgi:hypothetical protein
LNEETKLRVIGNLEEADLILSVALTRRQGEDAKAPDQPAKPRR